MSQPGGFSDLLRGDPRLGGGSVEDRRRTIVALQRSAGNATVARLLRQVAPPAVAPGTAPDAAATAGGLLVGDEATAGPAQMPRGQFLDELHAMVTATAETALAGSLWSAAGCPWIDHWIEYYRGQEPARVEEAIRRYAPKAAGAETASEYMQAISGRVRAGIEEWRATGVVPDLPEGAAPGPATASAAAAPGPAAAAVAREPAAVQARLGEGLPLEAGVSARMGAAFGRDLSTVRVHTDPAAATVTREHDAGALTVGRHVAFAPGRYEPGTPLGDALIAHEVAHVIQQDGASTVSREAAGAEYEVDADAAAADALTTLWAPGARGRRARPSLHSGLALQRCGEKDTPPSTRQRRPYEDVVGELRSLQARKRAVLDGTEPESALPEIEAGMNALMAELRDMGITLDRDQIMDRVEAAPEADLRQVGAQLEWGPRDAFWGADLTFQVVPDYVPPGSNVRVLRWMVKIGPDAEGELPGEESAQLKLDDRFWMRFQGGPLDRGRKLEVTAEMRIGDHRLSPSSGPIALPDRDLPESVAIVSDPAVVIAGGTARLAVAGRTPRFQSTSIDWDVDGETVAQDRPAHRHVFDTEGEKAIAARVYSVRRRGTVEGWRVGTQALAQIVDKQQIKTATTTVRVQTPTAAGQELLDQIEPSKQPSIQGLERSIESSIAELQLRVADGGEQQAYWQRRLEGQQERLQKLRENVPDLGTAQRMPGDDPSAVSGPGLFAGQLQAALILPRGEGRIPLTIYLTCKKEGERFKARLLDMTSTDVYSRDGEGATAAEAYVGAFQGWIDDHPYPRHGTVVYNPPAPDWGLPTSFVTNDTAWETAKAWLDPIISAGGMIIGTVLLLTPEPTTLTKWLGAAFVAAAAARSAVAIYENLQVGIEPLDQRNVLEGISIVTSSLGLTGTALRSVGISTLSPFVYRTGNWMVMGSLAGDVGTMAFATAEAFASVRAIGADPTLDDSQKQSETLRIISSLMASGALFYVTNRDLLKQGLRPSDFIRTQLPGPDAAPVRGLSTGSRLDFGLESRRAGDTATAERVKTGKIDDAEILDRNAMLPWLKRMPAADVPDLVNRLDLSAMARLQGVAPAEVKAALDVFGDDALFNRLARHLGSDLPPVASQLRPEHLSVLLDRLGPHALADFVHSEVAAKRVPNLQAVATKLQAGAATEFAVPATAVDATSVILDSNVLSPLRMLEAGVPWTKPPGATPPGPSAHFPKDLELQDGHRASINALAARADALRPPGTAPIGPFDAANPATRADAERIRTILDIRAPNIVIGEAPTIAGVPRGSTLEVNRSDPAYAAAIAEMADPARATRGPVGEDVGGADRAAVADALFATRTGGTPEFLTADQRIFTALIPFADPPPVMPPLHPLPGTKGKWPVRFAHANAGGFTIVIQGRTLRVVPLAP